MTDVLHDYSTSVLSSQPPIAKNKIVSIQDVELAWRFQVEACDRFEQASLLNYPPEQLDGFHRAMTGATAFARETERLYRKHYDQLNGHPLASGEAEVA